MTNISTAKANGMDAVSHIALRFKREPAYVVRGTAANGFYVAKWKLPPSRELATDCVLDHTLCSHLDGAVPVSKVVDGRSIRKRIGRASSRFSRAASRRATRSARK